MCVPPPPSRLRFSVGCADLPLSSQIALCAEFDHPRLMELLRIGVEYSLEKVGPDTHRWLSRTHKR